MYDIINCANEDHLYDYLDDVTNILRALAMDPNGDIQKQAC